MYNIIKSGKTIQIKSIMGAGMKILIEIDSNLMGCEVVIRSPEINEEVHSLQRAIANVSADRSQIVFYQNEKEYYFEVNKILFFETSADGINAHTSNDEFQVKYKLYELEELLPAYFMRISKSTILNTREIYSITKSLTASSVIEFQNTHKKVYASRNYYRALKSKLDEK